jgi:hypothetical protein
MELVQVVPKNPKVQRELAKHKKNALLAPLIPISPPHPPPKYPQLFEL